MSRKTSFAGRLFLSYNGFMNICEDTLDFIDRSPSCFHVVENLKKVLLTEGFIWLKEDEKWDLKAGGKYFVVRNGSSIISFVMPEGKFSGFYITASHSDSPSFKLKENPELPGTGAVRLNVEKYGGMLMNPWFDRPLSLAGRVVCSEEKNGSMEFTQKLVNFDRNLVMIPNLAIHMKRDANEGHKIDVQGEMMPVVSLDKNFSFKDLISRETGIDSEKILSWDLFLYNRDKGCVWGAENEFISSPKLDDLECVYTTFKGFLAGKNPEKVLVHAVFDNEEVGSQSRQGAGSTLLKDVLLRINGCAGGSAEDFNIAVAGSFLVSADNAHGVHPSYVSSADPVNRPVLNGGPVIKFNASQKYTSDSLSGSIFKKICQKAGVPCQVFTNNSNVAGGSTLGNISTSQVSVLSVDIGIAQWAMHSPNESAGSKDPELMVKAIKEFYCSKIEVKG